MSFKRAFTWTVLGVGVALGVALWLRRPVQKQNPLAASDSSQTLNSPNPSPLKILSSKKTDLVDTPAVHSNLNSLTPETASSLSLVPTIPLKPSTPSDPGSSDHSSSRSEPPSVQTKSVTSTETPVEAKASTETIRSNTDSNFGFRSAPSLQQLLQNQLHSPSLRSVDLTRQTLDLSALKPQKITSPGKLDPILLEKIELDPLRVPASPSPNQVSEVALSPSSSSSIPSSSSSPQPKIDPRSRLLGITGISGTGEEGNPKKSGEETKKDNKDPATAPSGEGDTPEEEFGGDGPQLSLAKPYCFLLPKSSPALECAKASVKAIVEEYARADVQVIPVFRWWGDDYPRDPGALESAATEACNLEKAFPWTGGGKMTGSIQAFVEHAIPNEQCGIRPPEELRAAGCSSVCPEGGPSFSTVSQDKCSPGVAVHESGHSNCCGRKCHNEGDPKCRPENESAGCGLCLDGSAQNAFLKTFRLYLANKFDGSKECSFTPGALQSLREGASPNPGYKFKLLDEYRPKGKKYASIYGQNGIRKVIGNAKQFSEAPPKNLHDQNRGEGRKPAANTSGDSRRKNLKDPKTYTPEQIRKMVGGD